MILNYTTKANILGDKRRIAPENMGREKVQVIKVMKKLADEEAGIKDFMQLK